MRTADHFIVFEPVFCDGPEVSQGLHGVARVENVVDHALEVVRVVRVRHDLFVEDRTELIKNEKRK